MAAVTTSGFETPKDEKLSRAALRFLGMIEDGTGVIRVPGHAPDLKVMNNGQGEKS